MKLTLLIISLFVSSIGTSQNGIIVGKVTNQENSEALPFVNIGIANKTVGTVSNIDGLFKLELNDKITKSDTVIFSYIGFRTEKILVTELRKEQNRVILKPVTTALDEVIVSSKKNENSNKRK